MGLDPRVLRGLAQKYSETRDYITNEEMTKQALIVPLIAALGYDPTDPREVRLEYTAPFTVNDGKRLPDRMDYAIFSTDGRSILLVIEAKPLGFDVRARSPQLARYMSQMPELRFGIITDGCNYLLFSDLNQPNVMDPEPFFSFSLADPKLDFDSVTRFLTKFSREQFNAERLVQEAEDSVYRQRMTDRLIATLRSPEADEGFIRWLTEGLYAGKRTTAVMERMGRIAREAMQPAILRTLSDEFLDSLRLKINEATADKSEQQPAPPAPAPTAPEGRPAVETTADELDFFRFVRDVCAGAGEADSVTSRDTQTYFAVSLRTRWFVRLFANGRRRSVTTWVPVDEARSLAEGFDVEPAPAALGVSRVYLDSAGATPRLAPLILRSLEISKRGSDTRDGTD